MLPPNSIKTEISTWLVNCCINNFEYYLIDLGKGGIGSLCVRCLICGTGTSCLMVFCVE